MPTLSFIVPTRNRAGILGDVLATIASQDLPDGTVEIVVADDGSTDDTRSTVDQFARSSPFPARWVQAQGRGVNAARNAGIGAARGELLVFVDDDEFVPPDHGAKLLELAAANADVGGFGGPVVMTRPHEFLKPCRRCGPGDIRVAADADGRYRRLLGGNMALRRDVVARVGLFDAAISGRGDEVEWFHRASDVGVRLLYDDLLVVGHRRDHLSFLGLLRKSYRDGKGESAYGARTGLGPRPGFSRLLRFSAHAVMYRCTTGAVRASTELGHLVADQRSKLGLGSD
jgi:glycosyltransferase involved in cell wall biosynthesis